MARQKLINVEITKGDTIRVLGYPKNFIIKSSFFNADHIVVYRLFEKSIKGYKPSMFLVDWENEMVRVPMLLTEKDMNSKII